MADLSEDVAIFLKACFLMKAQVVVSIYLQDALRLEHHNLSYEANHGHPLNAVGAYFSYIHTLKAYIYTVSIIKPENCFLPIKGVFPRL